MRYVYGVTSADAAAPEGTDLVAHGDLAAVTRPVEHADLHARRRDLLHHAEVVQHVFDRTVVVPLRFGTVVDDVVEDLLEPRHDELSALLRELNGLVEMTVRAVFREDDLLRSLLHDDTRLARLRGTVPDVQLGEAVARAVADRRERDAGAIVETLRPHSRAVAVDELRTELDVFRGAFLVERKRARTFDETIDRVAKAQAATTSFKILGPLPPHHFVDLAGAS